MYFTTITNSTLQKFGVPNINGQITIASELPYCISCQGVIQDFATMFPNVKVYLVDGIKNMK